MHTFKLPSFKNALSWLDQNILLLLSGFLLAFVPLFPKIPIYSPIEQYIVRVRPEDVVIGITILIWFIQFLRRKVRWQSPVSWLVIAYIFVSLLSVLSAIFIIKTVPLQPLHVSKTFLHFFRYIEYFSLLFVVYSSIRSTKDAKLLLGVIVATIISVGIYGIGQKYYYWPVYSTMNREFSKGIRLYLTEHARVQSTFAGHYDLTAYLVIVLPIILAIAYKLKHRGLKLGLFAVHALGVWLLIVGAARTSFFAYGVSMVLVVLLFAYKQKTWWHKIRWGVSRLIINGLLISTLMMWFGDDIAERFVQVLESYPAVNQTYHQVNKQRKDTFNAIAVALHLQEAGRAAPPPNSLSTDEAEVLVASDARPSSSKPSDVFIDVPDKINVSSTSATGETKIITIEKPRTWSENSLRYGLSFAIRLDTLWPQAIRGFLRDPLFGSGYATLNKTSLTEFTIAESTDNNLLRTLGETGLLGFITFYGAIAAGVVLAAKQFNSKEALLQAVSIGYIAAAVGLLINAIYIDVFAASKVAFTFWSVTGLLLGYIVVSQRTYGKKPTH